MSQRRRISQPGRSPTERPSAISIDVDALRFYGAIHGLAGPRLDFDGAGPPDPIYAVALPRFFDLVREAEVPGTVFFIASDVGRAETELVRGLRETGSELASHSFSHDYRLTRRSRTDLRSDLAEADRALRAVAPEGRVFGFRAPGYNTSAALLEALVELGYRYDSSLLPSPTYFAARSAAIARYALLGRRSASLVGDLRAFWGPLGPYRTTPSAPWQPSRDGPLVELPMAVEPTTRVPLIGTSWVLFPRALREAMLERALRRNPSFLFEMHAIDLLDATDPGVPAALVEAQPDLKRPAKEKVRAFRSLFRTLAQRTRVQTMAEVAQNAV